MLSSRNVCFSVHWHASRLCGISTLPKNFVISCFTLSSSDNVNRLLRTSSKIKISPLSRSRSELSMELPNWLKKNKTINYPMIWSRFSTQLTLTAGISNVIKIHWLSKRKKLNKECTNKKHLTRKLKNKKVKMKTINWPKKERKKWKKLKLEWKSRRKSKSNLLKVRPSFQTSKLPEATRTSFKNFSTFTSKFWSKS